MLCKFKAGSRAARKRDSSIFLAASSQLPSGLFPPPHPVKRNGQELTSGGTISTLESTHAAPGLFLALLGMLTPLWQALHAQVPLNRPKKRRGRKVGSADWKKKLLGKAGHPFQEGPWPRTRMLTQSLAVTMASCCWARQACRTGQASLALEEARQRAGRPQAETPRIIGEQGRSNCLRRCGRINSVRQPT